MKHIITLETTTLLIIVLIIIKGAYALHISEIFFDAEGSDNNKEFIEICSDENISFASSQLNLSGFIISDLDSNDSLQELFSVDSTCAIITEDGFNFSGLNCTVYSAGPSIGNNLNNNFDNISLYYPDSIMVANSYYEINESFSEGLSVHFYGNSSFFGLPTPCFSAEMPSLNLTNRTQTNAAQNISETNISNNSSFHNNAHNTNQTFCNYTLKIVSEEIFNNTKIKYSFNVSPSKPADFEITYWIEDFFGQIIKENTTTENLNQKQYTPSSSEQYFFFIIHAMLNPAECDNSFSAKKNIFYISEKINATQKSNPEEQISSEESTTKQSVSDIVHVYSSSSLSFGKALEIKLRLLNTDSDSDVLIYVMDENNNIISEKASFRFFQNSEAVFSQKLSLAEECSSPVNASIVLEAFDNTAKKSITVDCAEKKEKKASSGTEKKTDALTTSEQTKVKTASSKENTTKDSAETNMLTSNTVYSAGTDSKEYTKTKTVYLDSAAKAKRMVPYFLFFSVMLAIFLILWHKF